MALALSLAVTMIVIPILAVVCIRTALPLSDPSAYLIRLVLEFQIREFRPVPSTL
jgi:hypothetical protein